MAESLRAVQLPAKEYRIVPSPAAGLARFAVDLDAGAATVTWTPDSRRGRSRTYPLGLGTSGAATGLRRVRYRSFFGFGVDDPQHAGKVLLVDADGRVLQKTRPLPWPVFERVFPPFDVQAQGFTSVDEQFATTRQLQRAHRGATPFWPITSSFPTFAATLLLFVAVLVFLGLVLPVVL